MYKSYVPYLQHILDECLYVHSVITDDMQIDEFLRDETLKRAVTRSLSMSFFDKSLAVSGNCRIFASDISKQLLNISL